MVSVSRNAPAKLAAIQRGTCLLMWFVRFIAGSFGSKESCGNIDGLILSQLPSSRMNRLLSIL
jgi:hypothetical protein